MPLWMAVQLFLSIKQEVKCTSSYTVIHISMLGTLNVQCVSDLEVAIHNIMKRIKKAISIWDNLGWHVNVEGSIFSESLQDHLACY